MSRQHRHEGRHHRDDVENRYQEDEEDDRRYRHRDDDHRQRAMHRDYDERSETERAPSDRAVSEFILDTPRYDMHEQERYDTGRGHHGRSRERSHDRRYDDDRGHDRRYDPEEREASEIYAEAHQPPPVSEMSHYAPSQRTYRSGVSDGTMKTKTSRHGNLMMETMAAPHPCCPNTKGVCCLMLLLNLAILLIALGFVIILQLFNPPFVWFIGLALLIGGFCALIFCLVYCVWVCKDAQRANDQGELYWTHHWQKQWGYQPSEKPSEPYREPERY
ncbi:sarcoplasmic reticulum histidine-rich calcium-binding protein-like isoform X2 [Pollicipes pollicipes]|uniref:sarcoplasmic reticulum histidine-rich calcium-binding protein-like isoform X2 n=1 Tax=Pollicipes pollicipes TaxID=41117 RepID=UPI001884CEEA|nr:sarcoplasmic reticulum histidine-rich calcium-binding protein-like isoform X2 [Pollicipes pollicipes]XP_037069314.1 sarcoplasmic reticulum histidine-rich calcium-binding protein-like isoform X2 [Pollicipes pollicipes]XP_037069698.1 sarcoplasmic reticulum histidine-rich calcium-binding protein-like isoform X2 [Pollicipes pollicipes]XP_037094506.1 sarcoplasmic reticulum histidine-rich calcium-binding protein-like isoform X2 [Pollicipes pollicipes]